MANTTKQALEQSLKKLMQVKALDKITIRDITTDCGISRMAFYYHFKDIYDLIEWVCIEDAGRALQGLLNILMPFTTTPPVSEAAATTVPPGHIQKEYAVRFLSGV